jgi:hypothetical protein
VWPERVTLLGTAGADRSRRQDFIPFLARGRLSDTVRWVRRIVFPPSSTVALRYDDIPGPYPWRLARGRLRTARYRRAALRARLIPRAVTGDASTTLRAPSTIASVLRKTVEARPLWIDVRGRSMGRSIRDGSKVRVEMATRPRRSEVWAFCDRDGNIVVHRCRGERSGAYRFQGDARVRADELISSAQLIGRVVQLEPHRASFRWGALAGGLQRTPRIAIAALHRGLRMGNARGQR